MTKKVMKGADGMYTVHGKKFHMLIGSRAQVWHGTAYKTAGGLTKNELHMNKNGRIVSKKKHATAKKGKFGAVKRTARKTRSRRRKTGRK